MQMKYLKCSSATYWSRFLFKSDGKPLNERKSKVKLMFKVTQQLHSVLFVFVYRWKTSASHCTMRSV